MEQNSTQSTTGSAVSAGASLVDASGYGRQEKAFRLVSEASRSNVSLELERYPPGPEDEAWLSVPGGLQPSLLKSEFLRMADGMGNWLDISRQDRIRIIGNGVVPEAAAMAWIELWNEIG